MTELETFLVALIGELAADLIPLIEKLVEGAQQGKSPIDVLAEEDVATIVPPQFKVALMMAAQRAKYDPSTPPQGGG